jgi:ADP-heptose:LPS heptosyltransferase
MPIRRWPLRHYIALVRLLEQKYPDMHILLIGGPNDVEDTKKVKDLCGAHVHDFSGRTTLPQAFALMEKCKLFITHDSGPMHMAASVGTPVISIFGPVHPERKAPQGERNKFIWQPESTDALCDDEGSFPKGVKELACMREVEPKRVFQEIEARL